MAYNPTITGNGVTDTSTQRVTLSSDSTGQVKLAAGTNAVGSVTTPSVLSSNNTFTSPPAANTTLTGTREDVSAYKSITVVMYTDQVGNSLTLTGSLDSIGRGSSTIATYPTVSGSTVTYQFPVTMPWFRLTYSNGSQLASQFYIMVYYSSQPISGINASSANGLTGTLSTANNNNAAFIPASGILGFDGTNYRRILTDTAGNLLTAVNLAATTTGDTGAKTATGNGATQTNVNARGANILFNVGAVSGTSPTCVFKLQSSSDGGTTFFDIPNATTTTITASGVFMLSVYPGNTALTNQSVSYPLGRIWRVVWTIGGTTPSFTITNIQVGYIV